MESIHYHPGIYKVYWPYLGDILVPNGKEVDVNICNVVIHVGDQPVNRGTPFLATTIIRQEKNHSPIQHYIEEICTNIRLSFFGKIFHENFREERFIPEEVIRWIEVPLSSGEHWNQVKMNWNRRRLAYTDPEWIEIKAPINK